ncbi:Dirigent protein 20 [Linum grandiflorum]
MAATKPSFHVILLTFFLLSLTISLKPSFSKTINPKHEKLSHIKFYFHDIVSGPNPTAVPVVAAEGKYNGSNLSVLGRNTPFTGVREMPVVGGSGVFRFGRGYATARTHRVDFVTGDAVVEYNVYVFHY